MKNSFGENSPDVELDEAVADHMLDNIFRACNVTPNAIPFSDLKSWGNYKRTDFRVCKIITIISLILLVAVVFFFIPAKVQIEAPAPVSGADSAVFDLKVDSLLPIVSVRVNLNGTELEVSPVTYNQYQVEVKDNGRLNVMITLINSRVTSYNYDVTTLDIDRDSPQLVSSSLNGEELTVCVTDDNSGIDFENAYAIDGKGEKRLPLRYDEAAGELVFIYQMDNMNLFIPDKRGNVLQAVVSAR